MNEHDAEPRSWETEEESPQSRRTEPDWTESEWFQVWLELARRQHPKFDGEPAGRTS